jgi:hypothetical protein
MSIGLENSGKQITVQGLINWGVGIMVLIVGTLTMIGINDIRDNQKAAKEFQIVQVAAIEKINGRIDGLEIKYDNFQQALDELKEQFEYRRMSDKRLSFQIDQLKIKKPQQIK